MKSFVDFLKEGNSGLEESVDNPEIDSSKKKELANSDYVMNFYLKRAAETDEQAALRIADKALQLEHEDIGDAIKRIVFYVNREGKRLPSVAHILRAKQILETRLKQEQEKNKREKEVHKDLAEE